MKYIKSEIFYPIKRDLPRNLTYQEAREYIEHAALVIARGNTHHDHNQTHHDFYICNPEDDDCKRKNMILFARIHLEIEEAAPYYARLDEISKELWSMQNSISKIDGGSLVGGYADEINRLHAQMRHLVDRIRGEWGIPSNYGEED